MLCHSVFYFVLFYCGSIKTVRFHVTRLQSYDYSRMIAPRASEITLNDKGLIAQHLWTLQNIPKFEPCL